MAEDLDDTPALGEQVRAAAATGEPLLITAGGSKAFYGRACEAEPLAITRHRGIVNYHASELVLTARAGTPLVELEALLAENGQMFPFEPPHYGGGATLGGAVASGLSGPRRPFGGAVRDMVLGTRVMTGSGEAMRFGGEVIKNVAGYDVSRLMTGALGTLGILLEVSVKVLPAPQAERTVALPVAMADVSAAVERWLRRGVPVSATAHDGDTLYVRLSGAESAVEAGLRELEAPPLGDDTAYWRGVREHTLPFFEAGEPPLWRLGLPPGRPLPSLPGSLFQEWAGRQLWARTAAPAPAVREAAEQLGGHAACFRGGDAAGEIFHPLPAALERLHRRVKDAFDPAGIFNPGRLYPGM